MKPGPPVLSSPRHLAQMLGQGLRREGVKVMAKGGKMLQFSATASLSQRGFPGSHEMSLW